MRLSLLNCAALALLGFLTADASAQATKGKSATAVAATTPAKPAAPLAFAGETDAAVAARVFAYLDGLKTLQGGFAQIAPSGAQSEGVFYLKRPGLLRFDYAAPSPLRIVANGGLVYVRDEQLETTDSYPVGETPIKFLLRKKVDLKDVKIAGVERKSDSVAVRFASTDPKTEGELVAVFSAPDLALKQWAVHDPRGGVTVVTLRNVVAGKEIANRVFAAPETKSPFLKNR
jgi:outer membrane lipoprotein-sorting protein